MKITRLSNSALEVIQIINNEIPIRINNSNKGKVVAVSSVWTRQNDQSQKSKLLLVNDYGLLPKTQTFGSPTTGRMKESRNIFVAS